MRDHGVGSSRFQPGEGPSRGLLREYEPSDGPFFEALRATQRRHPSRTMKLVQKHGAKSSIKTDSSSTISTQL